MTKYTLKERDKKRDVEQLAERLLKGASYPGCGKHKRKKPSHPQRGKTSTKIAEALERFFSEKAQ